MRRVLHYFHKRHPHRQKSTMNTIKSTLAENVTGAHGLAPRDSQFSLDDVPDLSGKVAVITGGSEGIGYGCTHTLIRKNISKVFILSRSQEKIDDAMKDLKENFGEQGASKVEWRQIDLTDWKRTAQLASDISKETDRLDILINDAARGIMTYQLTDYGVDRHFAVNVAAPVILTSHLLPLLKKTATKDKVRIVNLASNAHQNAPKDTKFASLAELNKDNGPVAQYGRSKLANILYAKYLKRHLTSQHPNILANATHPGIVETAQTEEAIHEPYPLLGYGMSVGLKFARKDLYEGAVSTMFAATVTEKSGQYICPPAIVEQGTELANNEELEENLMKLTRAIVQEKTREDSERCPFRDF